MRKRIQDSKMQQRAHNKYFLLSRQKQKENRATLVLPCLPNYALSRLSTQAKLFKGAQNENMSPMSCRASQATRVTLNREITISIGPPHVDTPTLDGGGVDMPCRLYPFKVAIYNPTRPRDPGVSKEAL
jgi:hypothetical protein